MYLVFYLQETGFGRATAKYSLGLLHRMEDIMKWKLSKNKNHMKKTVIILVITALIAGGCSVFKQKNQTTMVKEKDNSNDVMTNFVSKEQGTMEYNENESYMVWAMMNVRYIDDRGYAAEREQLAMYPDFIRQLSLEIKTIIAFYSTYIRYLSKEGDILFAGALGDFSTLEEAQRILLKDKEEIFEKIKRKLENKYIEYLNINFSKNIIRFEYNIDFGKNGIDDFIIEEGNIIEKIKSP
jgi:hypothetical protein